MNIRSMVLAPLSCAVVYATSHAQGKAVPELSASKHLTALNNRLCKGWNTWYTGSVLTHVQLPSGFSISLQLVNSRDRDTLEEALIGKEDYGTREQVVPGPHAYDGSYTELTAAWSNISVRVQSAAKGRKFFLLISPLMHSPGDLLLVNPKMLWGCKGKITVGKGGIKVDTPSGEIDIAISGGHYSVTDGILSFSLDHAVALSTDAAIDEAGVEKLINEAAKTFGARKGGYKELSEVYDAMQTVLAWNTIYDPVQKRVLTPVSRNWAAPNGGWVLFDWDTYLAAYMLSLDNKDLAYANAIAITKEITKKGFVPNDAQPGHKSEDRTEPQVGAITVLAIYKRYREKWFLEEVFDELLSWNRWRASNRDVDGYLVYGTDPYDYGSNSSRSATESGKMKAAKWESGMDNSPMWDDAVFDTVTHRMMLADVGLMSLYIADCKSLSEIAGILGKTTVQRELNKRAEKYSKKLRTLWNEEFGLYLNKDLVTGKPSFRLSPTLFYPLLAKVPTQKQAERMITEHFYNPKEFWGTYVLPSIARNDPAFKDNHYWRGRIWAPLNFLVYLGIRNYDLPAARKDLVDKSRQLLLQSWSTEKHVYENYSAVTGRGDDEAQKWSDAFYHWGALLGFMSFIEKGYASAF